MHDCEDIYFIYYLYSNLEAYNIALVLGFSKASNSTTGPLRVEVEVDNVFVAVATFNSFKNCKVCWRVRGY